jgi:hypothetical protein
VGETLLRWRPVAGAESYHLILSPEPFEPPSTMAALASLGDACVHRAVRRNWALASRLGLPASAGPVWHWTVGIERGGSLYASRPRSFRLADTAAAGPQPIRKGPVLRGEPATRAGALVLSNGATVEGAAKTGARANRWIVRFEGPIRESWRRAVEARGARAETYLPDDALLVRASPRIAEEVRSSPGVAWVAPFEGRLKLAASLASARAGVPLDLALLLSRGEDGAACADTLRREGFDLVQTAGEVVRVRADAGRLSELAALETVRWIEPWSDPRFFNRDCQWVVQSDVTDVRSLWQRGLRGDDVLLAVCDTGLRTSHQMFRDDTRSILTYGDFPDHRKVVAYRRACDSPLILFGDDAGAWYHGTHTACTLAGNDSTLGASAYDGIAPAARLFFVDAGGSSDVVYVPTDLADLFLPVYEGNEAGAPRVFSNSWGVLGGGAYDFRCEQLDRFVWEHPDFLAVFSAGNGMIANSVASPAAAKNCVAAGGTENGAEANRIYASTSRGPTDDGRIKPTLAAPARLLSASGSGDAAYQTLDGTSMSAPSIAASAALAREYFRQGWYPSGVKNGSAPMEPSAALLRAVLVNAAANDVTGCTIPSNDVGWGRLRLEDALFFPGESRRLAAVDETSGLLTGDRAIYEVTVASSGEPLEVVLAWSDYPSSPAASRNLVNDLDLVVRKGSAVYRGNVYSAGVSIPGGTRDSLNVEECVLVAGPAAGTWTIEVSAAAVPFGPQPFALVVTGNLDAAVSGLALDRGSYGAPDTVDVRVEDANAAAVRALVSSDTEAAPETLSLAGSGGLYAGLIATTRAQPIHGDGALSVSHGDSIRVTYADASPSGTRRASACVSLRGPALRPAAGSALDGQCGVLRWDTDVPSDSRVLYGLSRDSRTDTAFSPDLVETHEVSLAGLLPDTTYFFSVSSADYRGNRTDDDGGSEPYRLSTGPRADVLVVIPDPSFEHAERYRRVFDRFGWNGAVAEGVVPPLGDRKAGLRSHPAVWWQAGWEEYPPFSDSSRALLDRYLSGGGRLAAVSHDAAWAFGDPVSPFWSPERQEWLERNLKASFAGEPSFWSIVFGASGDPISSSWATAGISYSPIRSGGAGDEVHEAAASATIDSVWSDNSGHGMIGLRWVDAAVSGDPDSAVWGGAKSRGTTYCFEWSRLNASVEDDQARASVLDKTAAWLIGRDHPDVTLTAFAGGGTIAASPAAIRWNEWVYGGVGVGERRIEWSGDAGASWNTITRSAGPSPYSWNLAGVPNGTTARVRVTLIDGGDPPLSGRDASDANITVAIAGNDTRGPRVLPGTASVSPEPVLYPGAAEIRATISDSLRGASPVVAAEWSLAPDAPGSGTPMSGSWGTLTAVAADTIDARVLAPPLDTIWIRGRDAAGVWGEASPLPITLRGDFTAIAGGAPPSFRLHPNVPNPFNPATTLRFDLPAPSLARLAVFDLAGRLVRTLVDRDLPAGPHEATWDGRDEKGRPAGSGVYFVRLESGADRATRKVLLLR